MIDNRRRMGLGEWSDKILIAAIGAIFIWFGTKVETLTGKVQSLCENMAAIAVELKTTRSETDKLRADFDEHMREDRERFGRLGGKQ